MDVCHYLLGLYQSERMFMFCRSSNWGQGFKNMFCVWRHCTEL